MIISRVRGVIKQEACWYWRRLALNTHQGAFGSFQPKATRVIFRIIGNEGRREAARQCSVIRVVRIETVKAIFHLVVAAKICGYALRLVFLSVDATEMPRCFFHDGETEHAASISGFG